MTQSTVGCTLADTTRTPLHSVLFFALLFSLLI
jgi:hypothetical protein